MTKSMFSGIVAVTFVCIVAEIVKYFGIMDALWAFQMIIFCGALAILIMSSCTKLFE